MKPIIITILLLLTPISAKATILITEIFPNPDGTDNGKEWIELFNDSQNDISLKDWKLENDGKSHNLTQSIKGTSFLLIKTPNSFLTNNQTKITLKDNNNKIIEEITYPNAPEGLSYNRVLKIKNNTQKQEWHWLDPSPNNKNPSVREIIGIISKDPEINKEIFFELEAEQEKVKIIIDDRLIKFTNLKPILQKGTILKSVINNDNILISYKIIAPPETKQPQKKKKISPKIQFAIPLLFLVMLYLKESHTQT